MTKFTTRRVQSTNRDDKNGNKRSAPDDKIHWNHIHHHSVFRLLYQGCEFDALARHLIGNSKGLSNPTDFGIDSTTVLKKKNIALIECSTFQPDVLGSCWRFAPFLQRRYCQPVPNWCRDLPVFYWQEVQLQACTACSVGAPAWVLTTSRLLTSSIGHYHGRQRVSYDLLLPRSHIYTLRLGNATRSSWTGPSLLPTWGGGGALFANHCSSNKGSICDT